MNINVRAGRRNTDPFAIKIYLQTIAINISGDKEGSKTRIEIEKTQSEPNEI